MVYLASGTPFFWHFAPSRMLGAMLSMPLAAYIVSRIPVGRLTLIIGGFSTALGSYTLVRILL